MKPFHRKDACNYDPCTIRGLKCAADHDAGGTTAFPVECADGNKRLRWVTVYS